MKTLGIIGGLGPQATAYFLELLADMTEAGTDQQHIPTIVISNPAIPDRTQYILGKSNADPFPAIIEIGKRLAAMNADYIAIPCMTAHYFHQRLREEIPVPVINGIEETAAYMYKEEIYSVGVMATDGTVQSEIFQQEFSARGIQVMLPGKEAQQELMQVIYDEIKAGKEVHLERFLTAAESLRKQGAQKIILGCTELSLLKRDYKLGVNYLDALEVLARTAVEKCGILKKRFENLI